MLGSERPPVSELRGSLIENGESDIPPPLSIFNNVLIIVKFSEEAISATGQDRISSCLTIGTGGGRATVGAGAL